MADSWRLRRRTLRAMAALCLARLVVALLPFRHWRERLGHAEGCEDAREAARWAAHVERGAARLPFETKCLPRAMALSWLLRNERIAHELVLAVRPADTRDKDALHAWIEAGDERILGNLPGPWHETLRLDGESRTIAKRADKA